MQGLAVDAISLAQTLPESKPQNPSPKLKTPQQNKHKKLATTDKTTLRINMLSKCRKMADFSNADIQNLMEMLGTRPSCVHPVAQISHCVMRS